MEADGSNTIQMPIMSHDSQSSINTEVSMTPYEIYEILTHGGCVLLSTFLVYYLNLYSQPDAGMCQGKASFSIIYINNLPQVQSRLVI
jgi:hypothetical protein